jgi:hypothetical protein
METADSWACTGEDGGLLASHSFPKKEFNVSVKYFFLFMKINSKFSFFKQQKPKNNYGKSYRNIRKSFIYLSEKKKIFNLSLLSVFKDGPFCSKYFFYHKCNYKIKQWLSS